MARIATGSIVADISGKVGDNIYSRNRQGPYVKSFAVPVQPDTAFQITARDALIAANTAWANLSDADYISYVSFTSKFKKSGFSQLNKFPDPKSFFIGNHINKTFADDAGIPLPVFPSHLGFVDLSIFIPSGTSLFFQTNGGISNSNFSSIYYSTFARSLGVRSINTVQQVFFHTSDYLAGVSEPLFTEWNARFAGGLTPVEDRFFGSVRVIHKVSGIQVGFAWNSVIVGGIAPAGIGSMIIESTFIVA
ncbi:hypothetical protein KAR91_14650 [Candidatus Pacearchaeota archaeon]|nr:hypothetical protein [Candidatus Pacearchaeota archaeon]